MLARSHGYVRCASLGISGRFSSLASEAVPEGSQRVATHARPVVHLVPEQQQPFHGFGAYGSPSRLQCARPHNTGERPATSLRRMSRLRRLTRGVRATFHNEHLMQRIVVLNPKGGSGKTTIAINLASYYALQE